MNQETETPRLDAIVSLSYDELTGCWIDGDGQAWTVSATADIVDFVRDMKDNSRKCPLCRRRFGTTKEPDYARRRNHVLNDHSSWSRRSG